MKKFILTIILTFAVAMTGFAASDNVSVNGNKLPDATTVLTNVFNVDPMSIHYTFGINESKNRSFETFLELTPEQEAALNAIHEKVSVEFEKINEFDNIKRRSKWMRNVIDYDLQNVRIWLDDDQFRKYRYLLQETFTNRGYMPLYDYVG